MISAISNHNMKTILTTILAITCFIGKAQVPKVDGQYQYQEVVQVDKSIKTDLFKKAKIYFVDNFKSANDVIQYQDADEGKIIGKGYFSVNELKFLTNVEWQVYYGTEILCKDGKYRYRLYDITIKQVWSGSGPSNVRNLSLDEATEETTKGQLKKVATNLFIKMTKEFDGSILSIKDYMSKSPKVSKDEF